VRIKLYGSYARGDYQTDSDIDIVAIVQGERSDLQERLKKIWDASYELELEYDTILSPTVIPYAEYEKYKDCLPYYKNIESEGVDIDVPPKVPHNINRLSFRRFCAILLK
jgi:predicted nucleotidyltransferase